MTIFPMGWWVRHMAVALVMASSAMAAMAGAQAQHRTTFWSPGWMASVQPIWGSDFVLPTGLPARFDRQTVRQVVRTSVGGRKLRVVLSNEFGTTALHVDAASVARPTQGASIVPGTDRVLRFDGRTQVTLAPGTRRVSDPVDLLLPPLGRLTISLYLPEPSAPAGFHFDAREPAYVAEGNVSAEVALPAGATTLNSRVYISEVLVETPRPPVTVVVLGDSITDGNGATPGADTRWPDALAARLTGRGVGALNAGISGGRLLTSGMGLSGLERARRDVFGQPGIQTMVVLLGTNDIGWPGGPFAPQEKAMSAEALIAGFRELIAMARMHNVRIVGGTLTPFERALEGTPLEGHYSPDKERVRQAVNQWIRESGAFDAVVDFDRLLRDPDQPSRLKAAMDSGDHLHPNDAGYKAMAQQIDLDQLLGKSK